MGPDPKRELTAYYDLNPNPPQDIPFYRQFLTSPSIRVLELGCGTGRILTSLASHCGCIVGIDSSESTLARCRAKLVDADMLPSKAWVQLGDVTGFDLGDTFDLIIAPYVFQYLQTDEEVCRFLTCVRNHLGERSTCIINIPQLTQEPKVLQEKRSREELVWETDRDGFCVTCHRRLVRVKHPVLFFELVYRRYRHGEFEEELISKSLMRCWCPQEIRQFITDRGFEIVGSWGGYHGQPYGTGSQLVIQFADRQRGRNLYDDSSKALGNRWVLQSGHT